MAKKESKKFLKIGVQGLSGSYSELAAKQFYNLTGQRIILNLYEESESVVNNLLSGKIDNAILPIENSIIGGISLNIDLIIKNNLQIMGEHYLKIEHCLLAKKGQEKNKIREVYSHPAALDQCRLYLKKMSLRPISTFDTAGAVAHIKKNEGIIAGEHVAELYNLQVLEKNIQNMKNNFTRFFQLAPPLTTSNLLEGLNKFEKCTLAFGTKHKPGSLVSVLKLFAKNGINLTKLESRPVPENPFNYIFLVDFEGPVKKSNFDKTLKGLSKECPMFTLLGKYRKSGVLI